MNWKELEDQFPKAWDKLEESNYPLCYDGIENKPVVRDLYEFFDEQEIYIYPRPVVNYMQCRFYICDRTEIIGNGTEVFQNRKDMEEAAFTKAFEILEERLK